MNVAEHLILADVIGVRNMRRDLQDYRAALPVNAKGRSKFTYETAIGYQKLQYALQQATTLALIDTESNTLSFHARPDAYLKSQPLAALHFGDDQAM